MFTKTRSAHLARLSRPLPPAPLFQVHALIQKSVKKHAEFKAMGTRTFLGMHDDKAKAPFPLKIFGDTTWKTYGQVGAELAAFGRGLRALGMAPLPLADSKAVVNKFAPMRGPHCLLIFEETCADWMTAALGAMSQSMPVATSYSTLGMGAVAEAINQTSAPTILCNYKDVARVATLEAQCKTLRTIIYSRNYVEAEAPDVKTAFRAQLEGSGLTILSFDEVIALGNEGKNASVAFSEPDPEHVGLIMYTSGSTGKPKGVMLKHSSIVSAVGGMFDFIGEFAVPTSRAYQETYLAYLPAAHILEFAVETVRPPSPPTRLFVSSASLSLSLFRLLLRLVPPTPSHALFILPPAFPRLPPPAHRRCALPRTPPQGMLAFGAAVGYSDPKTISSKGAVRRMPDGSLNSEPTG